ncbi:reverse transcriptase domain-containing protein [Tanacetum coccineum]
MKGAPECMRISGFMNGVNNPELIKRLNEHVLKTMEEMMTVTTVFIRGEVVAASKKKGHSSWKSQDQSKWHIPERRSDFRNQSREGRGSNRFTPLTRTHKEILAAKAGRFKPPPPMVTPVDIATSIMIKDTVQTSNNKAKAEISGHMIHRMYVDGGSSTEVLYEHCFNQLRPEIKNQMVLATPSLTGFSGETIWPLGQLRLLVTIGDAEHSTKAWFVIFSANGGIVTIRSTILIPAECAIVITSSKETPNHENLKVVIHPNFPDQEVAIGGTLSAKGRTELCSLLNKNLDIFPWQPSDMTGVPRSASKHQLNIREGYSPVRQKKRGQAPNRVKAIQAEVQKLVEAWIMREVFYHEWLSNPIMSLNGKLANLNRFLSKSAEKSLPLFKTLKKCIKKSDFHWTSEAEQAFKQLKQHLSELPLLVAPKPKEQLIVYLSASYGAVSVVLMTERGTVQTTVYFISRTLQGPELNYTPIEKLVLSLIFAAKRLRRYFQAHPISVITDQPIKQIISHPDVAGRLQKWSVMTGEHNITYRPKTSVKRQILADFLVEKPDKNPIDTSVVETPPEPWTLFTDGSSCVNGSGAGLILTSPKGTEFTYALRFQFIASNNEAEYEALIAGLRIAAQMGVRNVQVSVDSKLVANKVLGTYVAKEENMVKYLEKVKRPQSVVAKAMRLGYYWPTMHRDAREMIRACNDCQIHRPMPRNPQQPLTPITTPWPFYKWGINIAGPFLEGPGKGKFLIVAMDYFTKWIEAKAVATITGNQVKKFVWDNIRGKTKAWVRESRHAWAKETRIGTKVVIPAEIGMPTYRTTAVDAVHNDEELWLNLDLLEEKREHATICEAKAKRKMTKYYNARVRGVTFRPKDFVYRSHDASHAIDGGKLGPK